MVEKLRQDIGARMENAPDTRKARELREEILANAMDKYQDLLDKGKSQEEAYRQVMDGIGDIESTFYLLEQEEEEFMTHPQARQKSARDTVIAIGLYFLAAIVLIGGTLLEDRGVEYGTLFSLLLTLVIAGGATCLLVYSSIVHAPYRKKDDTFAEEYKEREDRGGNTVAGAILGVLWPCAVGLFLFTGLRYGMWAYNWIIFPVMAGVSGLVRALTRMR